MWSKSASCGGWLLKALCCSDLHCIAALARQPRYTSLAVPTVVPFIIIKPPAIYKTSYENGGDEEKKMANTKKVFLQW